MFLLADLTSTELWWRIGLGIGGLFTGGLGGAILTQVIAWRNARKQPINYKMEVEPLLPKKSGVRINAQATIDGQAYDIARVSILTIDVINTGAKDFPEFDFSVLVNSKERVVAFATPDPTPFLVMAGADASVEGNPKSAVKFICRPFNRGDAYSCKLIVFSETEDASVKEATIGSGHPVQFIASPTTTQLLLAVAKNYAVQIGPIKIGLH